MKSINEAGNLEGKKVIIRTDWNVPTENGQVTDTSRILASLETIKFVLEKGGNVIIISHFGRAGDSLKPAFESFSEIIPATFVENPFSSNLPNEKVIVLENIRKWKEEEENNEEFAEKLADLGEIYVNDAFSNSHRKHASIVGIPIYIPSFAGFGLLREIENLSKAFNPPYPFLFILGGAKFDTKMPLLNKFLNIADEIFIGGALAKHIPESSYAGNTKISLPMGDIGALFVNEETVEMLKLKIEKSNFILWNGPLDNYENGYKDGTIHLAQILAQECQSGKKVILGGGDTLAILKNSDLLDKFTFVSTAGGAMLEFLANGTLPGIEALN